MFALNCSVVGKDVVPEEGPGAGAAVLREQRGHPEAVPGEQERGVRPGTAGELVGLFTT